jgi:hypothetical protein
MSYPSDPRLLVLHGLRIKGVAAPAIVAEATGLAEAEVAERLAALAREGLVVERTGALAGWSLTAAGRDEHDRLVGDEVDAAGARPALRHAYEEFRALNGAALDACSRWQVRDIEGRPVVNDHGDPGYDADVVADLADVERQAHPVCDELAGTLDRYAGYGDRLHHAVERVEAGEGDWFTRPVMPSFHTVWFELHEDLITTLGINHSDEADPATETTPSGAS